MLKRAGKVGDDLIRKIMRWRHTSGFSVHGPGLGTMIFR
jgi:hypothetical protein